MLSFIGALFAPVISIKMGLFWVWLLDYISCPIRHDNIVTLQPFLEALHFKLLNVGCIGFQMERFITE